MKPLYKKLLFAAALSTIAVVAALFLLPVQTKRGYVKKTLGICVGWPVETIRHRLWRDKQKFSAVHLIQASSESNNLSLVCGKYEVHKLYIL